MIIAFTDSLTTAGTFRVNVQFNLIKQYVLKCNDYKICESDADGFKNHRAVLYDSSRKKITVSVTRINLVAYESNRYF